MSSLNNLGAAFLPSLLDLGAALNAETIENKNDLLMQIEDAQCGCNDAVKAIGRLLALADPECVADCLPRIGLVLESFADLSTVLAQHADALQSNHR